MIEYNYFAIGFQEQIQPVFDPIYNISQKELGCQRWSLLYTLHCSVVMILVQHLIWLNIPIKIFFDQIQRTINFY